MSPQREPSFPRQQSRRVDAVGLEDQINAQFLATRRKDEPAVARTMTGWRPRTLLNIDTVLVAKVRIQRERGRVSRVNFQLVIPNSYSVGGVLAPCSRGPGPGQVVSGVAPRVGCWVHVARTELEG